MHHWLQNCLSFCVSKAILQVHISQLMTADDNPLIVGWEHSPPSAPPSLYVFIYTLLSPLKVLTNIAFFPEETAS